MKILICDDIATRATEINQTIGAANCSDFAVTMLTGTGFTKELESFFSDVRKYLIAPKDISTRIVSAFDGYDLIIVDNNLAELDIKGAIHTAETVVGYMRAFSTSTYFISLNKNPDVDFDLRFLVGDFTTHADLALNAEHLKNTALWTGAIGTAQDKFLPWYWPRLCMTPPRRRAQLEFLKDRLSQTVTSTLGFSQTALEFLSLHALGTLDPYAKTLGGADAGKAIDQVSFCDVFLARDRSLPVRSEREDILAAYEGGNTVAAEVILRVVAADIDLWFRRDVLGPQEALVDVPHLLLRMPFLLGKGAAEIARWNRAIEEPDSEISAEFFQGHIQPTKFAHDIWVPSTSFWWPSLKENEKLNELFFGENQETWLDVVFCEDTSQFAERVPQDDSEAPAEFSTEFEGSWARRHVARLDAFRYAPRSRFAV